MADQKVSDLPSLNGADVDAADLLYIIDSSAGSAGSKKITVGQYQLAPVSGGTANGVMYLDGSKVVTTGSALVFDGTNLGIGTSSPGAQLNVVGDAIFQAASAPNNFVFRGAATSPMNMVLQADQGSGTAYWITAKTNSTLHIGGNGGSEPATGALVVDSSGNLGLGVTPSAWTGSGGKNIEVGATGNALFGSTSLTAYTSNANFDSSWKYSRTGFASRYEQQDSNHRWFTAPSGTAGNAISFTQAMTLDASGNLLVGSTDSTLGKFAVRGVETTAYNTATFGNGTDVQSLDVLCGRALTNNTAGGVSSSLVMTLRSSGSSPGILAFATGNNERGRVSGGDLIWGTTTTPSLANAGFVLAKDGDGTYLRNACTITATRTHFEFVNGNGTVGTISTNASATAYNTSSDRRLKENIVPAADAGPVIDAIEIVQHDWKVGGHTRFGVIAQDLNAVAPEAVSAGDDGDEIEKTWGVDYSKLVPMLIKEIQTLRARVAALESA